MDCFTLLKVFLGKFHFTRVAAVLLAGLMSASAAGKFALPAEGPVAFRRDRLPLDVDTMGKLSMQLVELAKAVGGTTPTERRGAAQMLALAIALDPGNARARRVLEDFESGKREVDGDAESLSKSRARIWQWIGWLESPEAGEDGHSLVACLKDVLAISDPYDPRVAELRVNGQAGAWKGWIPADSAYEEAKAVVPVPVDETPPEPAVKPEKFLAKATVLTPLWKQPNKDDPEKWTLALSPLSMRAASATEGDDAQAGFSVVLGQPETNEQLTPLIPPLLKLLASQHGRLPMGRTVRIDSPELEASLLSGKRHSISGSVAVLASSAISGREPEAIIIGTIGPNGVIKLPTDFWEQLRTVKDGTSGRLILPADAAVYLPSILAMENPKFFMDHEVVLAADFKELLELSAKTPGDAFGRISAQFNEIRGKMGTQPLGQYVANSYVRRRLAEISQAAPYHYSAKMLATQGAGNRPIYVIRPVVLSELRKAIEPLDWMVKHGYEAFEPAELNAIGTTFETCRGEIERLLHYTEKADREVVDQVQTMVALLRPIERAGRSRQNPDYLSTALDSAISAFLKSHKEVSLALGNKAPVEPPAVDR